MSRRDELPRPKLPTSHYFFSLSRGERIRTFALRPLTAWTLVGAPALLLAWASATTAYMALRDDFSLFAARETQIQSEYEARLADVHTRADAAESRHDLERGAWESRMRELISRQVRLEQRNSVVLALAQQASKATVSLMERPRSSPLAARGDALRALGAVLPPTGADSVLNATGAQAFAPIAPDALVPKTAKPRPIEEAPARSSALESRRIEAVESPELALAAASPGLEAPTRLNLLDFSLDHLDHKQIEELATIESASRKAVLRLAAVVAQAGIGEERLGSDKAGVGGPYIPADGTAFERAAKSAVHSIAHVESLRRNLSFLPLRRPLVGEVSMTSPFGYRPDPFLGKPALHPGIDMVQFYGAEIHPTAAGKVIHAGPYGGYGNMVEVDHGRGMVTRYGHMSEVLVTEGQEVRPATVLGRIGSSGRSTGPHLHYEVRLDGEAVDPSKFLSAGLALAENE